MLLDVKLLVELLLLLTEKHHSLIFKNLKQLLKK